jgi:lysophospholipase L1-like esterase
MALSPRRFRLSAFTFGTIVIVAGSLAATTGTTLAASSSARPVVAGSNYLALGDSIAFGYRESSNMPTPDYSNATNFVGYPEDVAAAMGLKLTNAACPGETTSSMINKNAASNGCENGYRAAFPLHASYTGSQLAFAKKFLKQHPNTRLISLTVGANDAFLCQSTSTDGCVSEFGALLTTIKTNLTTIFKGIRGTGYTGQIVFVNYYSLNYSDGTLT